MMDRVVFCTPKEIDILDFITMGDSEKRNDNTKIGKFDSGLKYSLCMLLKRGIEFKVYTSSINYRFYIHEQVSNTKSKKVLAVETTTIKTGVELKEIYITGFSIELGFDWLPWMILRELYSNTLDENGEVYFGTENTEINFYTGSKESYTVFDLNLKDTVLSNIKWEYYFLNEETPIAEYENVSIYDNPYGYLMFYKNNILIYEDKNVKSLYRYDYKNASIDERRLLNNIDAFKTRISEAIVENTNKSFINDFLYKSSKIEKQDNYIEKNLNYWYFSTEFKEVCQELPKEVLQNTFPQLWKELLSLYDLDIGEKLLEYNPTVYSYVKEKVETCEEHNVNILRPDTLFKDSIEVSMEDYIKSIGRKYNFEIPFKIEKGKMQNLKCISDTYKKVIYCSENFQEDDFWEVVKAVFRLQENNIDYVYKKYFELLKK